MDKLGLVLFPSLLFFATGCPSSALSDAGDSGTVVDAGGSTDAGNVDAGNADAGDLDGGDVAWPHAPAGFRVVLDDPLDSFTASPWLTDAPSTGVTLESEAGAPGPGDGFIRFHYPVGYGGGGEPAYLSYENDTSVAKEVFIGFWVRANNWQGHPTGTNKVAFLWNGGQSPMIIINLGVVDSGPIHPEIKLQNTSETVYTSDGAYNVPQNVNALTLQRNQWGRLEAYFRMNDGNQKNGVMRLWVDGALVTEVLDYQFTDTSRPQTFGIRSLRPVWGGIGGTVASADMALDIAHYFTSSSP